MADDTETKPDFLDSRAARVVAMVTIVCCLALLGFYHRNDLMPGAETGNAGLNPDFVHCRDDRTGDVDKMLADGVITGDQHTQFLQRALAYCTTQFPPEGK